MASYQRTRIPQHGNKYLCHKTGPVHWYTLICAEYRDMLPRPSLDLSGTPGLRPICAEYRDMLSKPRLVCKEPGQRPIGRSPGVPDKSSRCLGSMSRYSAQISICFIAYIFHFCYSSVGLADNFAGLPQCSTVPSAIVHCNQNETGHQTIKLPACLA